MKVLKFGGSSLASSEQFAKVKDIVKSDSEREVVIVSAPGKALQLITTQEPDDSMLEVAIRAIELVIPEEKGKDNW